MAKTKQWKTGGEQDKFIEKLIKKGKITKFTKPASLKVSYPAMFGDFSANVVRNHLNSLKRSNGLHLDGDSDMEDAEEDETEAGQSTSKNPENTRDVSLNDDSDATSSVANVKISYSNYPVLCETFKDPETLNEKVILMVCLPSGAPETKCELNEDGTMLSIQSKWSKTFYDMNDLFKAEVAAKKIASYHPKVICLKNALQNNRKRIDSTPETILEVKLPIKVQTSAESWSHYGVIRDDGTKAIVAEFSGLIKEYSKKVADMTVTFNS